MTLVVPIPTIINPINIIVIRFAFIAFPLILDFRCQPYFCLTNPLKRSPHANWANTKSQTKKQAFFVNRPSIER